jgi:hypothetical protein
VAVRTYSALSFCLLALTACGIQLNEQQANGSVDAKPADGPVTGVDAPLSDAPPAPLPTGPFGPATKVVGVSLPTTPEDDVTMNAAETEMVFAIVVNGDKDLYTTKRASAQAAWGAVTKIAALDADDTDSAARISNDGLKLYYGGVRGGASEDIWVSMRATTADAWGTPTRLAGVNDNARADRWYNPCGGRFVMISDRAVQGDFDLYEAAEGAAPVRLAISTTGANDLSPFLTPDCLVMYWSHNEDIYMTTRTAITAPWAAGVKAMDLSKDGSSEQDPWMSVDRKRMYFASNADGDENDIYVATRSQ